MVTWWRHPYKDVGAFRPGGSRGQELLLLPSSSYRRGFVATRHKTSDLKFFFRSRPSRAWVHFSCYFVFVFFRFRVTSGTQKWRANGGQCSASSYIIVISGCCLVGKKWISWWVHFLSNLSLQYNRRVLLVFIIPCGTPAYISSAS